MPLYKITERRLKRKERDEEDPIAYLKAALRGEMGAGGSETDDDESDSDSDSDEDENEDDEDEESGSEDEEEGNEVAGPSGTDVDPADEDEGDMSALDPLDLGESDEEDSKEEDEMAGPPPMTITQALTDPIYPGPKPRTKRQGLSSRCVLCPGKTLQGDQTVVDHLKSSLHMRALKRYKTRIESGDETTTEDPREIVADIFEELDNTKSTKAVEKGMNTKKDTSANKPPTFTITPSKPNTEASRTSTPKPKQTKAERKAARATKLLEAKTGDTAEKGKEESVTLNRQARRILAQQNKGNSGTKGAVGEKVKEGKSEKREKGDKTKDRVEKEGKEGKKNKKSRKARKSAVAALGADIKVDGGDQEVRETPEGKRKEKKQKKVQ